MPHWFSSKDSIFSQIAVKGMVDDVAGDFYSRINSPTGMKSLILDDFAIN